MKNYNIADYKEIKHTDLGWIEAEAGRTEFVLRNESTMYNEGEFDVPYTHEKTLYKPAEGATMWKIQFDLPFEERKNKELEAVMFSDCMRRYEKDVKGHKWCIGYEKQKMSYSSIRYTIIFYSEIRTAKFLYSP